ncbi:MAG: hypothetical protein AABX14_00570 [Candidatus Aenigmatarchaeota archaeon]
MLKIVGAHDEDCTSEYCVGQCNTEDKHVKADCREIEKHHDDTEYGKEAGN